MKYINTVAMFSIVARRSLPVVKEIAEYIVVLKLAYDVVSPPTKSLYLIIRDTPAITSDVDIRSPFG